MRLWLGHSKNQGPSLPSPDGIWVPALHQVTICTVEAHKWVGDYSEALRKDPSSLAPHPSSPTRVTRVEPKGGC